MVSVSKAVQTISSGKPIISMYKGRCQGNNFLVESCFSMIAVQKKVQLLKKSKHKALREALKDKNGKIYEKNLNKGGSLRDS